MRVRAIKPWLRSPPPPAILVGREEPLVRLKEALAETPIAIVLGLGGIGKSALARAYAQKFGGPVLATNLGKATTSHLLEEARASLATEPVARLDSDEDRLTDLGRRIEARGALWIVDNLERLPEAARARWLLSAGGMLR